MHVGFIGLGNVGAKLAGSLLRDGFELTVHELERSIAQALLDRGAHWAHTAAELARRVDLVITCLPTPADSGEAMEGPQGVLAGLSPETVWLEMSTTEEQEVKRLGRLVAAVGAHPLDAPVSGGCHRAESGNISIFAGGERTAFEYAFPALRSMGSRILHTGSLGSASVLKVLTNYLASVHLAALAEAWAVASTAGADMATTYEAIKASSGNSFVHETESQVILNGSYDINFTLDLVIKDLGLFSSLAERNDVPIDVGRAVELVFADSQRRYGERAWSPTVAKRMEEAVGSDFRAPGFPAQMHDDEPEAPGDEIVTRPPDGAD
jgi:3-hydroxyisobutyrate dehydrogenase